MVAVTGSFIQRDRTSHKTASQHWILAQARISIFEHFYEQIDIWWLMSNISVAPTWKRIWHLNQLCPNQCKVIRGQLASVWGQEMKTWLVTLDTPPSTPLQLRPWLWNVRGRTLYRRSLCARLLGRAKHPCTRPLVADDTGYNAPLLLLFQIHAT